MRTHAPVPTATPNSTVQVNLPASGYQPANTSGTSNTTNTTNAGGSASTPTPAPTAPATQ
jgi:hypothetical protein